MKGLLSVFSFIVAAVMLSVAAYEYWGAYEVQLTRCQHVKHSIVAGKYSSLRGVVGICWDVDELQNQDGPVTWCSATFVTLENDYNCEPAHLELQARYPITSPPTFFDCWRAVGDYRRMFTYIPDTKSWQNKFYYGIFFVAVGFAIYALSFWTKMKSD
jgi:hypothetical protein